MKTSKELINLYSWLQPRNAWTDEIIDDVEDFCELDFMPKGWRIAFGEEMCEKINKLLLKSNFVDQYRISQIKEKYGELRWYDNGVPKSISEEYYKIIDFYSEKSKHTCFVCGEPAEIDYNKSYLIPVCDKCKPKII